MAEWPYQRQEFRFAGRVKDDSPGTILVWGCVIFFFGWAIWLLFNYPLGGVLVLLPSAVVLVALVVTGVRDGVVDAVVCTADGLSVERSFVFGSRRQTDTHDWSTITSFEVERRKIGEGSSLGVLVVDTTARRKALEVTTTLSDFDRLLDVIAAMTPQIAYRWVRSDPDTTGPTKYYRQIERTHEGEPSGRAA